MFLLNISFRCTSNVFVYSTNTLTWQNVYAQVNNTLVNQIFVTVIGDHFLKYPLVNLAASIMKLDICRHLAKSYSKHHPSMADPMRKPCDMSGDQGLPEFKDGITNGASWYSVSGGMAKISHTVLIISFVY